MIAPGTALGAWIVERPLGRGGMGSVYRCSHRDLATLKAAVKVLEVGNMPTALERFRREAHLLTRLDHRSIVRVRDVALSGTPAYLVMDLVEGRSLDGWASTGGMPLDRAALLGSQVASALGHAHSQGVGHRDVKPANVIVGPSGRAVLVDFGIAVLEGSTRLTRTGHLSPATVIYAPPEWISDLGSEVERWDAYSLGVTLVELVTGSLPFEVPNEPSPLKQALQLALNKREHPALDPGPRFPEELREIVRALTWPDPARRLCDMEQVETRLADIARTAAETPSERARSRVRVAQPAVAPSLPPGGGHPTPPPLQGLRPRNPESLPGTGPRGGSPPTSRRRLYVAGLLVLLGVLGFALAACAFSIPRESIEIREALQYIASPRTGWSDVAVGESHACAVGGDGSVYCWGCSSAGEECDRVDADYRTVATGDRHSCAQREDGVLSCWGEDQSGSVDGPEGVDALVVSGRRTLVAGEAFTCAIDTDDRPVCWGLPSEVVDGAPSIDLVELTAGCDHVCGLTDSGVSVCWGEGEDGQLDLPTGVRFSQLAAGCRHTCGLDLDGTVHCWGKNSYGQSVPPAFEEERVEWIAAGGTLSCAILDTEDVTYSGSPTLSCWGGGLAGLGQAFVAHHYASVALGKAVGCGLTGAGELICSEGAPTCDCGSCVTDHGLNECRGPEGESSLSYPP